MRLHRVPCAVAFLLAAGQGESCSCGRPAPSASPPTLMHHAVRVDAERKLLPWIAAPSPYAQVARLAWSALETRFPLQENGLPTYLAYSRFDPQEFWGVSWPHNPAGLYAMLAESAVLWYAFSGDRAAVDLVRAALDRQLSHGTTPPGWDWASVPYASADPGALDYRGADDTWCGACGRGDGVGVIEPDKVAELGVGYLQLFELTADPRYRAAALSCADALASHVRAGDETRSPWPFRVHAESNVAREEYSANVIGAIALFDELGRLGLGDRDAYARARQVALDWLMRVPMRNDRWSGYFEDIELQTDPAANPNQYSAMRTARWLLQHPEADPEWRAHVAHLLAWVARTFGVDTATERGTQWGATVLSEQAADMAKMGSHTARFGATTALWWEATGDPPALDRAARSLAWATYACDERGIVAVGEDAGEGWWFSDGYGDYIRHFLVAMGAVPAWAPPGEVHLLRSTSIVTRVEYGPPGVAWTTYDADSTETLRVPGRPGRVTVAGVALPEAAVSTGAAYEVQPLGAGDSVLRVHHTSPGPVVVAVELRAEAGAQRPPEPEGAARRASGCSAGAGPR